MMGIREANRKKTLVKKRLVGGWVGGVVVVRGTTAHNPSPLSH